MTNVHSFVKAHFGCFHILAIVNNPALNIGLQISFQITAFVFFGSQEMGLLGHIVVLFLIFVDPWYTFSQALHSTPLLYTPNSGAQGPLSSTFQLTLGIYCLFESSHADRCEVLAPCGFDLYFPDDQRCSANFHRFVVHLFVFFGEKMSLQLLCSLFNEISIVSCMSSLYILDIYLFDLQISSPVWQVAFCFLDGFLFYAEVFCVTQSHLCIFVFLT